MERLEVLALNSRLLVDDRTRSLADLIQMIRDTGGIPVLPWGVGKWTGARARVIEAILARDGRIVVADNGNRWRGSAPPFLIRSAATAGNPVMAGSDALPLSSQAKRAGCAGIRMEGDPEKKTAAGIFSALMAKPEAWARWNTGASAPAFVWHAIRMQF